MSSRVGRAAGARASTVSGPPPERDDVDDGGGDYRSTPENAACSVRHGRATTLSLGRCRLWPALPRPRMAGFEVSTEARAGWRLCVEAPARRGPNPARLA